jgi:L-alanine-DL-glutamate epimerase-like enolase superfamily enzyme
VAEEGSGSYFASAQFIDQRAGDIIRGDVALKGGITALVKLAHLCEAFGIMCEIHVGTNPFADMANLHVMCAIKNCGY